MSLRKLIEAVERGDEPNELAIAMPTQRETDLVYAAFRGSLDAAKALHEALLPGPYQFHVSSEANFDGYVSSVFGCHEDKYIGHGHAPNPARAWLLAILRAVEAKRATP